MDQVDAKFASGAKNTLMGWAEIFREPAKANNLGENAFFAIGRGFVKGGVNTLIGLVHVVTTPIPGLYVPMIDGGTDLL